MLDWHRAHGGNVSRTARHFGYARPTVYRWLGRFERHRLETLEDRPSRPAPPAPADLDARPSCRPSARSASAIRAGARTSSSSCCGATRIRLLDSHGGPDPRSAAPRRVSCASPADGASACGSARWARPYAIRRPAGWADRGPGRSRRARHARCPTAAGTAIPRSSSPPATRASRWDVARARPPSATAAAAADVPSSRPGRADALPGAAPSASTTAPSSWPSSRRPAQARGIALFVLPPRSPKLHGAVERANRTHTEEFYEVTAAEPDLASLPGRAAGLGAPSTTHVRPHQALGYLTPGRVPGLAGARGVTEVPNEYTACRLAIPAA